MAGDEHAVRMSAASRASVQGYIEESERLEHRIAALQAKAMAVEVALRLNAKRGMGRPRNRSELLLRAKKLKSARLMASGAVAAEG